MQIKFLGTGGAFNFEQGTASAIVSLGGKNILIDCGFSTILKLSELEITREIDYILITHLHGDHVGSLPTLLPYFKYVLQRDIPPIICANDNFKNDINDFLEKTFEAHLASYLSINELPEIGFIDTSNQHVQGMTSFSYYFTEGDSLIYYSGDIGNADTAAEFLATRTEREITVFHETSFVNVPVHAHHNEVSDKLSNHNVYAYHVAAEKKPADCKLRLVEEHPELLF